MTESYLAIVGLCNTVIVGLDWTIYIKKLISLPYSVFRNPNIDHPVKLGDDGSVIVKLNLFCHPLACSSLSSSNLIRQSAQKKNYYCHIWLPRHCPT